MIGKTLDECLVSPFSFLSCAIAPLWCYYFDERKQACMASWVWCPSFLKEAGFQKPCWSSHISYIQSVTAGFFPEQLPFHRSPFFSFFSKNSTIAMVYYMCTNFHCTPFVQGILGTLHCCSTIDYHNPVITKKMSHFYGFQYYHQQVQVLAF